MNDQRTEYTTSSGGRIVNMALYRIFHVVAVAIGCSSLSLIVALALVWPRRAAFPFGEAIEEQVLMWLSLQPAVLIASCLSVFPFDRMLASSRAHIRSLVLVAEIVCATAVGWTGWWFWAKIAR